MTDNTDNSGIGVVLGILLAVVLLVGGYFFLQDRGGLPGGNTTVNVETAEPAAGTPSSAAPAGE